MLAKIVQESKSRAIVRVFRGCQLQGAQARQFSTQRRWYSIDRPHGYEHEEFHYQKALSEATLSENVKMC